MTAVVSDALAALCLAAGVSPDDRSRAAGRAVCAALVAAGCSVPAGDTASPVACPLAVYLRRVTGIGGAPYSGDQRFLLVGVARVMLFGPRTRGGRGTTRPVELVEMPAAVSAAVRMVADSHGADVLARGAA